MDEKIIQTNQSLRLLRLGITNTVPLFGVLFFGWSLFAILFYYWLENGIIGFFNVGKMIVAAFWQRQFTGLILVPFFCLHFGGFMAGHLFFLVHFFTEGDPIFVRYDHPSMTLVWIVILNILPVCFSYLGSFIDFVRKKAKTTRLDFLFFSPYPRIFVMHITLLLGGLVTLALGRPILASVVLIFAKAGVDYIASKIRF